MVDVWAVGSVGVAETDRVSLTSELDSLRKQYRELVEAHRYKEAVDLFEEVGKVYYAMSKQKMFIPTHFLDPEDDLS